MTNIQSAAPYYNDFDELKNYHQILFRPGYSVQARELTQLQSILKNQVAKFGNHVFKQGSVVIPGNSFTEIDVPYVTVESTYLGNALNLPLFEGKIVTGQTSGVKAHIKKVTNVSGTDPITFYLSYTSGGTTAGVPNGKLVFDAGEILVLETQTAIAATTIATGNGSMAFVNQGVYYVNGTFVSTDKQSVVISKYNTTPSCHVLFKIKEEVIDETVDQTLLDPAQGSYNFAAPGADRLKLSLELVSLPLGTALTDDYVELMRYENGELLEHFNTPKYNELEKSLAQRTFDESGNYVVRGLKLNVREHRKDGANGGYLVGGDYAKFVYELSSGKAYVNGLAIENLAGKRAVADKARTLAHVAQTKSTIKPSWGQYILVADPKGTLDIQLREYVQLWDTSDISGGNQIGSAKVLGLDYHIGDGSAHPIYKLYISDLVLTSGSYDDIGSVRLLSANFAAKVVGEYNAPVSAGTFDADDVVTFNLTDRVATVSFYDVASGMLYAHKHSAVAAPKAGDTVVGPGATTTIKTKTMIGKTGASSLLFRLPNAATKALKDSTNTFDMEFTQWTVLNIPAGSTTVSVSSGTLVPIEAGTFIALSSTGEDSRSNYTLGGSGTTVIRSSGAPIGGISVYCQVQKNDSTPRTKTVATSSGVFTSASIVPLSHADVFEIISVTHSGVDITTKFYLDGGQTDFEYGISSLKLKSGFSVPVGNLTVAYKYFSHTVGDFFSVDSYPISLDNDLIPSYRSTSSGISYELRDCIDFRKTVGMQSNVVVPDTFITTSIQNYVPRIDVACIDKQGNLIIVNGVPSQQPKVPVVPSSLYALERFFVPAFTYRIDGIKSSRIAVTRYTMEKVASLENRILNIEQYSLLTAAETSATNTPFIDAKTGLDRFKTGYLVESMEDPFRIANHNKEGFTASINSRFGITSKMEEDIISLLPVDSGIGIVNTASSALISQTDSLYIASTVFNTGGVFTLPYYDKVFASVGVSSKITNVNPFSVIGWKGSMTLVPSGDVWVDVIDRPEIVNNTTRNVVHTIWVAVPAPAPVPLPAVPVVPAVPLATPVIETVAPIFVETPVVVGPAPAPAPIVPIQEILYDGEGGIASINQNSTHTPGSYTQADYSPQTESWVGGWFNTDFGLDSGTSLA